VNAAVASALVAVSLLAVTPAGATTTLSELFGFTYPDGDDPNYLIQASDGNLYGTTYLGGGTVFKLTPAGQFTLLFTAPYDPNGTNHYPDGEFYTSLAEGSDGLLYVAAASGNNQSGTIFRISKSGTDFQLEHGSGPTSLVPASDGNLYGVDQNSVFRLSTDGTFTNIYTPTGSELIMGGLTHQAADGNFYGYCYIPGPSGPQHVCRVTTSGQVTSIFQLPAQRWPVSLNPGSNGFLYGSVLINPNSNSFQAVFQLSTSGNNYQELFQTPIQCCVKIGHSYVIQASDGNLWVTNPNMQPAGSVYSITTSGTLLQTVAFPFQGATGSFPHYLIQASSGILYGATYEYGRTASGGGAEGTIFEINAGLPPK